MAGVTTVFRMQEISFIVTQECIDVFIVFFVQIVVD